jgi:hypothetical protein
MSAATLQVTLLAIGAIAGCIAAVFAILCLSLLKNELKAKQEVAASPSHAARRS